VRDLNAHSNEFGLVPYDGNLMEDSRLWVGDIEPETHLHFEENVIIDQILEEGSNDIDAAVAEWNRIHATGRAAEVSENVRRQNDARGQNDHLPSWHRVKPTDAEITEEINRLRDEL